MSKNWKFVKRKKEVRDRTKNMKAMEYFWGMGYITVALFAILQNGAFHSGNLNGDNYGNNKTYKKRWNEISQMFLIGSLSGIAVLGDVIRGYLPVNFDPVICVCQYGNRVAQSVPGVPDMQLNPCY
mgnify:CR=1 FL=1